MNCSVILSAYNGAEFLPEQLDSIVNQTRCPDEVVIIDDCSTDRGKTQKIISKYAQNYTYIHTYTNAENMGWAASFINGISLSNMDVIFFADQDDVWETNKIKIMMDCFESKHIKCLMSDYYKVDKTLEPIEEKKNTKKHHTDYVFDKSFMNPKGLGATMGIEKDFIEKFLPLWNKSIGHDRFCQIIALLFDKITYLDIPLIRHRFHESNATGKKAFETTDRIIGINGNLTMIHELTHSAYWECVSSEQKKIISGYCNFARQRREMLKSRSLIKWIEMPFFDLSYYPTRNTWFGDLKAITK